MTENYPVACPYPWLVGLLIEDDEESDEHLAYKITIETSVGNVVIGGCHDSGPDIIINEGVLDDQ